MTIHSSTRCQLKAFDCAARWLALNGQVGSKVYISAHDVSRNGWGQSVEYRVTLDKPVESGFCLYAVEYDEAKVSKKHSHPYKVTIEGKTICHVSI